MQSDKATSSDEDRQTEGGEPPEKVEDRPNVSTVRPEDYPAEERGQAVPGKART